MLPETIPGTDSGRKRSIAGVRKCLKNDFANCEDGFAEVIF